MTSVHKFNPCTYAFLAEIGTFHFNGLGDLKNLRDIKAFPVVLEWSIGNQTCEQVGNRSICGTNNNTCFDSVPRTGYNCKCKEGLEGNPYLSNEHGCKDINECTTNSTIHKHNCSDPGTCRNKVGGFDCKCQSGYRLDTITMSCKHKEVEWATILLAVEIAGTLAYLHSSASIPIIHRDVKTGNILLDENLTAKVADFGASRFIPMDKEQLTTMVQGTPGYLDPEYYNTGLLNEKSDVYSFGVVLMELLSAKKALCFERPQQSKHLLSYFASAIKENRLHEVIDEKVINENNWKEIEEAVRVAMECTRVTGEERPLMTEVAAKLEGLRVAKDKHQWSDQYPEETENLVGVHIISVQEGSSTIDYDSIRNVERLHTEPGC
uniref:Protein kinase domain-containing protein n=1 Tax=Brassica oleracea var. oleracea TaxID=109376 RepID=A0A0D3DQR0_BRAOL